MQQSTLTAVAIAIILGLWAVTLYIVFQSIGFFWMFFVAFGFSAAIFGWVSSEQRRSDRAEFINECAKTKSPTECLYLATAIYGSSIE